MKAIKKRFLLFVWTLVALSATSGAFGEQKRGKVIGTKIMTHPSWWKQSFLDVAEDSAEAGEAGKHLILFFHLEGCPYCEKMASEHFSNSTYLEFLKSNFEVVALNIRGSLEVTLPDGSLITEKQYARQLKVRFTPGMMFFNGQGQSVLRLDGLRSHEQFEKVLRYVASRSYEKLSLPAYLDAGKSGNAASYNFIENPRFVDTDNLSSLTDKPIMLILEDKSCTGCREFHKEFLVNPEVDRVLDLMSVVRWDALSEKRVFDQQGRPTTPKAFAEKAKMVYRPGVLLIDKGKILAKRNSYAVLHHFLGGLEYVATRAYLNQDRRSFNREREERLLNSGRNIDLSL